jgi:hypothetical protein
MQILPSHLKEVQKLRSSASIELNLKHLTNFLKRWGKDPYWKSKEMKTWLIHCFLKILASHVKKAVSKDDLSLPDS